MEFTKFCAGTARYGTDQKAERAAIHQEPNVNFYDPVLGDGRDPLLTVVRRDCQNGPEDRKA